MNLKEGGLSQWPISLSQLAFDARRLDIFENREHLDWWPQFFQTVRCDNGCGMNSPEHIFV